MSAHLWTVKHHTVPAAHVRGYARGTRNEETAQLRLSLKHYEPLSRPPSRSGDLSVVFCHGVGSSKETYEPFFDDLLQSNSGSRIRGIWCMDTAHHGESYLLNAEQIGDEVSWRDSARDVIHMINTFAAEIKTPIVGIGQSWGCVTLLYASNMHPRLFRSMIFIEPTLRYPTGNLVKNRARRVRFMAEREELWPSRAKAREALLKHKAYYALFDPRVFEKIMQYEVIDVTPDVAREAGGDVAAGDNPVRLRTPKSMEVYTMTRRDLSIPGYYDKPVHEAEPGETSAEGFYAPDAASLRECSALLLPSVLLVWGKLSDVAHFVDYRNEVTNNIGIAPGGGGGVRTEQVETVWVSDSRHAVPFEQPKLLATDISPWLLRQAANWEEEMKQRDRDPVVWTDKINPEWVGRMGKL